jgi:hypothetical protein
MNTKPRKNKEPKVNQSVLPISEKITLDTTDNPAPNIKNTALLMKTAGSLFDTLDIDDYRQRLDGFTINELSAEALRVGLKSNGDRNNQTRAIFEVFMDYRNKCLPNYNNPGVPHDISEEKKRLITDLMKDGK